MGPGSVTRTGEGWIATLESAHRRTHGSLQLFASGAGPEAPGRHGL